MSKKREVPATIERGGDRILLPAGMSYDTARKWLTRQEEAEEAEVEVSHRFMCYPLDGVVALHRAMDRIYGFTSMPGQTVMTWFGPKVAPPTLIQVPLGDGSIATAPISRIVVPTWEEGWIEPNVGNYNFMHLSGEIKKKFEPEVKEIIKLTEEELKERSIYKGQAMKIDLSWIAKKRFDPVLNAPKFITGLDSVNDDDVIMNDEVRFDVATNIFTLIERTEACVANKIPLRHGVLLAGSYGTGKTLLSRVIAAKSRMNGWSFIYLENPEQIAVCLEMAERYAPSVVFAEDIDRVMSGGRTDAMNQILNTIDGMDTKGKPIITILTTNSPEKIEPAFMRAGRMDTVIELANPDAKSAQEFVKLYSKEKKGQSLLAAKVDLKLIGEELAGMSPAFIAEAVHKAKRHAIHRTGESDIVGKVETKDLLLAAKSMRAHTKMAEQKRGKTEPELLAESVGLLGRALRSGNGHSEKGKEVVCPNCDESIKV